MWQKVSNDEHAHYKDICNESKSPIRPEIIFIRLKPLMISKPKNDNESTMCRQTGNTFFNQERWSNAMESYNRSLCYAETAFSELMSLALANRSACFYEMKKYDQCLVDIELAKKFNYPERLLPKLQKRKEDCLQLIVEGALGVSFKPKLSFEPHKKFPCMANILNINRNDEFGRHITTTQDISVGQTVLFEKAYMTAHRYEKFRRCDGCMKKDVNLTPCENCSQAMFCSGECERNDFHQVECGMQIMSDESCNDNHLHVIRSILEALFIFSTVEEVQTFVESVISSDPFEVPESIIDEKSRYRAFLKLWHEPDVIKRKTFGQQVYFVYQTLLENYQIGPKFNSLKKKRFLMHLIAQHFCIINYSGNIMFDHSDDLVGWEFNEFRSVITLYVNHSCTPNVALMSFDGYNVLVTIRPIKKGGQLFLSYFRNDKMNHSTADRKKYLLSRVRFCCKCQRCTGVSPSFIERNAMKSDECYQYVKRNKLKVGYGYVEAVETDTVELEKKCVEFLNKHGRKVWCKEIEMVVDCYKRLLTEKYNDEIRF